MKESKGYTKCHSEDFDPFEKCKPVNCEEKYLGKRNYFDGANCVPAKVCDQNAMYDYEKNECRNLENILDAEDRKAMENGNFINWINEADMKLNETSYYEAR